MKSCNSDLREINRAPDNDYAHVIVYLKCVNDLSCGRYNPYTCHLENINLRLEFLLKITAVKHHGGSRKGITRVCILLF